MIRRIKQRLTPMKMKIKRIQPDAPDLYKTEFLSQVQVITRKQGVPEKRMNIMKF